MAMLFIRNTARRSMKSALWQITECMKIKLKTENVEGYITRIQRELHIADSQTDIPVSAAIGYAWTSEKEKNLEKLLHEADEAMYENKKELKKER